MYHVGDSIVHDKFGTGTIIDILARSDPCVNLLIVDFGNGNIKRFPIDTDKIERC